MIDEDLIKSYLGKEVKYLNGPQMIFSKESNNHILDVRGWGHIQYMFKDQRQALEFQDAVGEWIADAINLKLRISEKHMGWDCPDSPTGYCDYRQDDGTYDEDSCKYCGHPDERK